MPGWDVFCVEGARSGCSLPVPVPGGSSVSAGNSASVNSDCMVIWSRNWPARWISLR